ncbi:protein kinase domain-containing protein [Bowmanella yangjiangensis]|uniref:Winged helix-turn-helix domain-containing protein n=1 Tax=Bowmanella yangjiangensis TaxID=2811230 RepID=A0ABS3CSU6_9ALTE|nr:winged helix-turn-helix domain-containing protein [Bowmanella yangjiangensis]MBN7820198.1 winged helix-turn-helix domain-containing protein [Bowmanella yangjiangensis]
MVTSTQDIRFRYSFGTACFDSAAMTLEVAGQAAELEPKPLELLGVLLTHNNEVMTKEELLERVWPGRVTVEHVLANAVAKLRKALGKDNSEYIQTQPKIGYRFVGVLQCEAISTGTTTQLDLHVGQSVPQRRHFHFQRQLAANRHSEVWLAAHHKTHELRVYKFSPDGGNLSILKREMTLARLLQQNLGDRPDLCRLLDWNFEQPPFFLEYQYGGEDLLHWSEQHNRLASLSSEQRLTLALQLTDALAAAHQSAILHKDLKPANILVAPDSKGFWQIKLTDFGVGSLLDPRQLEALSITVHPDHNVGHQDSSSGTPLYLAPEVLRGEMPTIQSDIYALGVLIYQLLSGDIRKPLTSNWQENIDDPLLCEDIALACHSNPQQRIHSAAALAERMRNLRHRHNEQAMQERQQQLMAQNQQKLQKLRAARPWLLATLVALVLGLTSSLILYRQAWQAAEQARLQTDKTQAISDFLTDLLKNADPHNPGGSGNVTVRQALDRATDAIPVHFKDQPLLAMLVHQTAAHLYTSLADYHAAARQGRRQVELLAQHLAPDASELLLARYQLAEILVNASEYDEARQQLELADANSKQQLQQNASLDYQASRAHARYHLLKAQIEDAASWLQRALLRIDPADPMQQIAAFRLNMDLAQCYSRLGQYQQAIDLLLELHSSRYQKLNISDANRASAKLYLGAAYLYSGHYSEAESTLQQSIAELIEVFGSASPQVLEAKGSLGNLYATSGRWAEALPLVRTVRDQTCRLQGENHLSCMMQSGNEGVILLELQEPAAAVAKLEPAMHAFAERLGQDSPGVQVLGYYLACAYLEQAQYQLAAPLIQILDPARLTSGSPGEGWDARVAGLHARLLIGQGQQQEGRKQLLTAIGRMEALQMQEWIITPFKRALQP